MAEVPTARPSRDPRDPARTSGPTGRPSTSSRRPRSTCSAIDRWLRNFFYVNWFDSFEGTHPRVFVPQDRPYRSSSRWRTSATTSSRHEEVLERIERGGPGGKAVFVMFDAETERPPRPPGSRSPTRRPSCATGSTRRSSRRSSATRPACRARRTRSAARRPTTELTALAESAGLGDDLVVQTPYGDSGKTTFFIRGERDWDRHAGDMVDQELKVMKRINVRAAAVEAALTRHGTIVGPLMNDLIGHPELTPHKGGWCGNDIFPDALSPEHLERARMLTQSSATGWPPRATAASSRSTTSSTSTRASSTSASSIRASAA